MDVQRSWRVLLLGAGLSSACGDAASDLLETVSGRPSVGEIFAAQSVEAPGVIDALAVDSAGNVVAVVGGEVLGLEADAFVPRVLYAGPGDPRATGTARALAPRLDGGLWVAAEAGLFYLEDLYLSHRPLGSPLTGLRAVSDRDEGNLEGLWIAADSGVVRLPPGDSAELVQLDVCAAGPCGDVAVTDDGETAFALADGRLERVLEADGELFAEASPVEVPLSQVAAAGDAAFAAGAGGLVRWQDDGASAPWTHFTFAPEAEAPQAVRSVAVDASTAAAWARTGSAVIRVEASGATRYYVDELDAGDVSLVAIDPVGDVWLSRGASLTRWTTLSLEDQVSFATDLVPWLADTCGDCHDFDQDGYEEFAEIGAEALAKVRRGEMPRCPGGKICPRSERLPAEDYAILELWVRLGMAE